MDVACGADYGGAARRDFGVPASEISNALLRMEASGTVLRGNFSGAAAELRSAGQPGAAVATQARDRMV